MWDPFKPKDNTWYWWRLNGAAAYLRKEGELWQTAFTIIPFQERNVDFGGPEEHAPPDSLAITHAWGTGQEVSLHPYLSAQPYLLTVKEQMRIAPGQGVSFIATLPPVLKFELASDTVLSEAMPFALPQTWFGSDTMTGAFCHALTGGLFPSPIKQAETSAALISCEILVKNNAKTMFELKNFAVYPEPLNVYLYQGRLIADTLELDFWGTEQKTTIGPVKEEDYKMLSAGIKSGMGETLARWSVDIIKNITGF
jgi:hypothetical protein